MIQIGDERLALNSFFQEQNKQSYSLFFSWPKHYNFLPHQQKCFHSPINQAEHNIITAWNLI